MLKRVDGGQQVSWVGGARGRDGKGEREGGREERWENRRVVRISGI